MLQVAKQPCDRPAVNDTGHNDHMSLGPVVLTVGLSQWLLDHLQHCTKGTSGGNTKHSQQHETLVQGKRRGHTC